MTFIFLIFFVLITISVIPRSYTIEEMKVVVLICGWLDSSIISIRLAFVSSTS